ncbi:MAG: ATP synthase subunit I [Rhodanobacter sp.]|nr:MAG: ATP synthase subunit I [Rhodanobacter sp.]
MHELMIGVLATLAGVGLGAIFFGGLWWTVRKGVTSRQPALWFMGSLLLRMGLVVAGFALVGGGDWRRLLLCLLGLAIGRIVVTRLTRSHVRDDLPAEMPHAP